MVSAIGSSSLPNPASTDLSSAGLTAQLGRYQKELSECVNCSSAKTSEGKIKITELSGKISELKTRIEEASAPKSPTIDNNLLANVPAVSSAATSSSTTETLGNRLNVFA